MQRRVCSVRWVGTLVRPDTVAVCLGALLAAAVAPAQEQAQSAAIPLEPVVVTATRTQTRAEDSTASVSVISGDDIGQRDQTMVGDALRGAPGMDVTEFGAAGQTAFATIRGSNPDQVLVLLDGVEVNT
ncbi:MAG: TonB-dependent receptor plug domain-containing protein, partial [Candidatus Binatia bacterium]